MTNDPSIGHTAHQQTFKQAGICIIPLTASLQLFLLWFQLFRVQIRLRQLP